MRGVPRSLDLSAAPGQRGGRARRHRGPGRHGLLRQGRGGQDHGVDEPGGRPGLGRAPPGCCSSTSTSRSVTSRSACSWCPSARPPTWSPCPATSTQQGLASVVTRHEQRPGRARARRPSRATPTGSPAAPSPELLRVARRHVRLVILDTPPAFTEHVLAAFDASDVLDPVGNAGHPGGEEPAADARHARAARAPRGTAGSSCSTAPTPRSGLTADDVTGALQPPDRGAGAQQPGRAGVGQPRRADRARRAQARRQPGAQGAGPRPRPRSPCPRPRRRQPGGARSGRRPSSCSRRSEA